MAVIKLNKPPLIDVICEIRFLPTVQPEVVTGMIFHAFEFLNHKNVERLPAGQIPEAMRLADPNLKYVPLFKCVIDRAIVQFGPLSVSISSSIPYIGWNEYRQIIDNYLMKLFSAGIVQKIERIGIRCINFFNENVMEKVNFQVDSQLGFPPKTFNYLQVTEKDGMTITITLASDVQYNSPEGHKKGYMLDIDTSSEVIASTDKASSLIAIDSIHNLAKEVFFKLIRKDALAQMEPEND